MVGQAIQQVLARTHDRLAIGSLADLKRAYEDELVAHGAEIAAHVDKVMEISQQGLQRITTAGIRRHRRCDECGGPIENAKRLTRWYCSDRCRLRAHRKRHHAAP